LNGEQYEKGLDIRKSLGIYGPDGIAGSFTEFQELAPAHVRSIVEYCFGVCWNQPLIDQKTREMLVVAAAAAQDLPGEVEIHSEGLLNQGVSPEEIVEAIVSLCPYIGFPKTNHALRAAKNAIEKKQN
jgi:AhpD family alkylhydroperoxidase